jgi:tRNA dimethylallyltransferase
MDDPLIVIAGPTASGKSELGIYLALALGGEVLNCDALQVYKGMDIGTAKVLPQDRRGIPHHLVDLVNPDEHFSAGDYMRLGRTALAEIRARKKIPIVVGGTGLYLRALLEGLFAGPSKADELRQRLRRVADRKGVPYLHSLLKRVDPSAAEKITPNDGSRIIRALEVYYLSGQPISEHFKTPTAKLVGFTSMKFGLNPPRRLLYERINQRVERLFVSGLVDEVAGLLKQGFPVESKAFTGIGYRQIIPYLAGSISLAESIDLTKRDTRRYAKRQMTWFRKEKDMIWLAGFGNEERIQQEALNYVKAHFSYGTG